MCLDVVEFFGGESLDSLHNSLVSFFLLNIFGTRENVFLGDLKKIVKLNPEKIILLEAISVVTTR